MASPPLVFTTDFGLLDPYAGVIKGVALTINPELQLIDLTHQVAPQNVSQGSFLLGLNYRFFPNNAIHIAVVDPGVGTDRRPILLSTPLGCFVAPDNGLLSGVLAGYLESIPEAAGPVALPKGLSAIHLTNPSYWRQPVSHTFHGRDMFTPVAAHLSLGVAPEDMGEIIDDLFFLPMAQPMHESNTITGQIIYQDTYGNLVSNIPVDSLPSALSIEVQIEGRSISGLSRTFNNDTYPNDYGLIALAGSHGYLEVAVQNGSAAGFLGIKVAEGIPIVVISG
jgi:S-adenosylmethionine hydrolase